jgi:hypothetical protein
MQAVTLPATIEEATGFLLLALTVVARQRSMVVSSRVPGAASSGGPVDPCTAVAAAGAAS